MFSKLDIRMVRGPLDRLLRHFKERSRLLQLYAYHVEISFADILERMRCQSLGPKRLR